MVVVEFEGKRESVCMCVCSHPECVCICHACVYLCACGRQCSRGPLFGGLVGANCSQSG